MIAETTVEAQLFERHSDLVYRYCLRMLGSREDAEDAAQTTFIQALRAVRRGVVPTFEQAWLLKIASNECKSRHRAGWRRSRRELPRDPQSLEELAEAPTPGDDRLMGIRHALARLPEMQRRALLLREWQGYSYAEIAHELGVSLPAVEALLFRARRSLARELGGETRKRRHALDVASLLAALKSALGGGAAVKLAAGVAALATVGAVAAGSAEERAPAKRVAAVERLASTTSEGPAVERRSGSPRASRPRAKANARTRVARGAKPAAVTPAPSVSKAPRQGQEAPPPAAPLANAEAPGAPPVEAPAAPTVPEVPVPPPPPAAPLPPVEVPQVSVPAVPLLPPPPLPLPEVPEVPALPEVPDLPVVGDLPLLP